MVVDDVPPLEDMSGVRNKEISVTDKDGRTVKVERADHNDSKSQSPIFSNFTTESAKFPPTLEQNHTQTSASSNLSDSNNENEDASYDNDDSTNATSIKIEPITENEMELEITGVELGNGAQGGVNSWGQGQVGFVAPGNSNESINPSTEAAGYSKCSLFLCLHWDSLCLHWDSLCLHWDSLCLHWDSLCLHWDSLCLHWDRQSLSALGQSLSALGQSLDYLCCIK